MRIPSDQDASGRSLGEPELTLLGEVIASGVLTSTRGSMVKALEVRASELLGARRAVACSSGTAAVHTAVACVAAEPGDEIISSPVTDMGAITPILYQACIPVFADVDARTGNVTADSIEARLSPRTRAVIVTHLFGNPAPIGPIRSLTEARGLVLIEDCSQAYLARSEGRQVGTVGDLGCFSLQQGKHATCGEGGLVVTHDRLLADRAALFVNKAWDAASPEPDHRFLALNYRMSELQGAVALAQLDRLEANVSRRVTTAEVLSRGLDGLRAVSGPWVEPGDQHSYWRYAVRVDLGLVPEGPKAVAAALAEHGIASSPGYIRKPAFECEVIRDQRTFGQSRFPFTLARPGALDTSPNGYPGTYQFLAETLVLPWSERHSDAHARYLSARLGDALGKLVPE